MLDQEIVKLYWNRDEKAITETKQKYGYYDIYNNAAGIVYGDHPYSIAIFTSLGNQNTVIGDINAICYAYFNGNLVE